VPGGRLRGSRPQPPPDRRLHGPQRQDGNCVARRVSIRDTPDFVKVAFLFVDSIDLPISISRHIKPTNKGFKMLAKMGWSHGQGLGKEGAGGNVEPVSKTTINTVNIRASKIPQKSS